MIMLSVVLPTPLRANAVSDDDTKKLYIIGTIASYAGINIDLDAVLERFPNFLEDVMDLAQDIYDELADEYSWNDPESDGHSGSGVHRDENNVVVFTKNLENYLDSLSLGLFPWNPVSQIVNYKFILCVVRAIAQWCSEHITSGGGGNDGDLYGSVIVDGDYVDLYTSHCLTFTFPTLNSSVESVVHFHVNNCSFDFYVNASDYIDRYLWGYSNYTDWSRSPRSNRWDLVIQPDDCDLHLVYEFNTNTSSASQSSLWNGVFSEESFYFYGDSISSVMIITQFGPNHLNTVFSAGYKSYFVKEYNNSYAFVNRFDYTDIYNNLTFNSLFELYKWFFGLCGIDITLSHASIYVPSDSTVVIDNNIVEQTITTVTNNINNDNSTTSMVFPSYYVTNNYYNYDDYRQHPEYILDFNQGGLLDTDFNMPAYDGNKLANKFPFCIPFDVYNLISNFVAEPEAPQFHWLVLPANSFGMSNEAFYIDLDFTPYNFLVQLMRFFIAVGFVIFLMVKTKDLMQ